jgi:O-methyltransferase involved in polyketide biosynthesis
MKPISKTAFYCCGVRMQDAASVSPLIGDQYAKRLMGNEGLPYWEVFKKFKYANASNVARHYTIDLQLKEILSKYPDATIIVIGSGLDSRPYRFSAGNWIELDEPAVMNYKNEILPVEECKNKLQRIAIDFQQEKLSEKLAAFNNVKDVVIVIEGVLMYLDHAQKIELIQTLTSLFKKHILICDLMKKRFFNIAGKYIHKKLMEAGSQFVDLSDMPNQIFFESSYYQRAVISNILIAADAGLVNLPGFMVHVQPFRKFMEGYSVYRFEFDKQ